METAMTLGSSAMAKPPAEQRSVFGRTDGPLVRAVARAPVSVRTKLLVGFITIAALLVVVGVLGLVALGKSNARVAQLGTLQKNAAAYKGLESDVDQIKNLLLERANM